MRKSKIIGIISLGLCLAALLCACNNESTDTTTTTQSTTQTTTKKPEEQVKLITKSVIVIEQNGSPVANVTVNLTKDSKVVASGKTDANGVCNISAPAGDYVATFDNLPEGYLGAPEAFKFNDAEIEYVFTVINNIPDGSAEKPFMITENETVLKLAPKGELYYTMFSSEKIITVHCQDIEIVYNGNLYAPNEHGVITFLIVGEEDRDKIELKFVNIKDQEIETTVHMQSPEGAADNPFKAEIGKLYTASIGKDGGIYYRYVAEKDGIVEVVSNNELNNICLTNVTTSVVTSFTSGAKSRYLNVKTGDEILVTVSSLALEGGEISFSLGFYTGKDDQPLMFEGKELSFGYNPNQSVCFIINNTDGYNTIVIEGASAKVIYLDETLTPDDSGVIKITLSEIEIEAFAEITVINDSDERHEITFKLKNI